MGVSVCVGSCPQQTVNHTIQVVLGTWAFVVTPVENSFHTGSKLLFPRRPFQATSGQLCEDF